MILVLVLGPERTLTFSVAVIWVVAACAAGAIKPNVRAIATATAAARAAIRMLRTNGSPSTRVT